MKRITIILLTLILSISASSCSLFKEQENKVSENLLKYYNNDDFYFSYSVDDYCFRLPMYWKGKFAVDVVENEENFYEYKSFNEKENGLLFSIKEYNDKSFKKLNNYEILGKTLDKKSTFVLVYPDEENVSEENQKVYNELKEAISIIKATFTVLR